MLVWEAKTVSKCTRRERHSCGYFESPFFTLAGNMGRKFEEARMPFDQRQKPWTCPIVKIHLCSGIQGDRRHNFGWTDQHPSVPAGLRGQWIWSSPYIHRTFSSASTLDMGFLLFTRKVGWLDGRLGVMVAIELEAADVEHNASIAQRVATIPAIAATLGSERSAYLAPAIYLVIINLLGCSTRLNCKVRCKLLGFETLWVRPVKVNIHCSFFLVVLMFIPLKPSYMTLVDPTDHSSVDTIHWEFP